MSIGLSSNHDTPPSATTENRAPRGILRRDREHQANGDSPAGQINDDDESQHGHEPAADNDHQLGDAQQDAADLADDELDENDVLDEPAEPVRVQDVLPTAPVATASVVPGGWTLSALGLPLREGSFCTPRW